MRPDQWVAEIRKGEALFSKAQQAAVKAAAEKVRRAAMSEMMAATAGTMTLRGVKTKDGSAPARLDVVIVPMSTTSDVAMQVRGRPGAMWSWLEKGTKAHVVGTGKRGGVDVRRLSNGQAQLLVRSRRKNKETGKYETVERLANVRHNGAGKPPWVMAFNNEVRQGPWKIRGAAAKHTFSNGVNSVDVGAIMNRVMTKEMLGKMFG